MQRRLLCAVRALLRDPGMAGLPDAARLAAVVLAAKARSRDSITEIQSAELGRWLGMSESAVKHAALPRLRETGMVRTRTKHDDSGRMVGLECVVVPLWRVRRGGDSADPLALTRPELATLLRLLEALFGPGWVHKDGSRTLPGLLADRQGRGAATDRLALLLMVLDTRANGWVRLCGGAVAARRGRAAVTLGRSLGCSAAGGEKVLGRLKARGLLEVMRTETASGLDGASRLRMPVVAAAHRTGEGPAVNRKAGPKAATARTGAGTGPRTARTAPAAAALGDREPVAPRTPLVAAAGPAPMPGSAESAGAALLHAVHAPVAAARGDGEGGRFISGEAVRREPTVADDARAREALPVERAGTAEAAAVRWGDTLRMPTAPPASVHPAATAASPGRTGAEDPRAGVLLRRRVRDVLDAIPPVRDRLAATPGRLKVAAAAVGAALATTPAPVLAAHLQARLAPLSLEGRADDPGTIRDPLAWLLSQLPRITICQRCGRTSHGSRTGVALCAACAAGPALPRPPVEGCCRNCAVQTELTSSSLCGGCDTSHAISAAADRATAAALGGVDGDLPSACPPGELRRQVEEAAAAASARAAAAGANIIGQRTAARLAADLYVRDLEHRAVKDQQCEGAWTRRHQPGHGLNFSSSPVVGEAPGAVFFDCAGHGCRNRVVATDRPESGLCTGCERRRMERERRVTGPRWRLRAADGCSTTGTVSVNTSTTTARPSGPFPAGADRFHQPERLPAARQAGEQAVGNSVNEVSGHRK